MSGSSLLRRVMSRVKVGLAICVMWPTENKLFKTNLLLYYNKKLVFHFKEKHTHTLLYAICNYYTTF